MARASAQITLCLCFHSDGADARVVRPYIVIMAVLICKMVEIVRCSNACRDARPVRPLKHSHVYVSIPMGADARAVRPYTAIMAVLMCKMVEMVRCSNACRDARPVRPLKHPHVYISIPMGRTHEPCVPTLSLWLY